MLRRCVCGTPTDHSDNEHAHYSNKVVNINRVVGWKLLLKKAFKWVRWMILWRCYFKLSYLDNSLSPCQGQLYCINLSRWLSKCNLSHIELRVIKTVCHCSFHTRDCTVIELLCNIRITSKWKPILSLGIHVNTTKKSKHTHPQQHRRWFIILVKLNMFTNVFCNISKLLIFFLLKKCKLASVFIFPTASGANWNCSSKNN